MRYRTEIFRPADILKQFHQNACVLLNVAFVKATYQALLAARQYFIAPLLSCVRLPDFPGRLSSKITDRALKWTHHHIAVEADAEMIDANVALEVRWGWNLRIAVVGLHRFEMLLAVEHDIRSCFQTIDDLIELFVV